MKNNIMSLRHLSLRTLSFATCFLISSAAFANTSVKFADIPADQIAQDVQQTQNPQTGAIEFQARSFDPFEAVDGLAGTVSLRSNSHSTAFSGQTLSGGAVLDINFFYVTESDDPYDVAGFETAAFDAGDYADTIFYDNRIVECSGDIHNVVYQNDYYAGASFGLLAGVYRPFPLYRGHQFFNPYGFVYDWRFPSRLTSTRRFSTRSSLRNRLRNPRRSANQIRLANSRFTGRNLSPRSSLNRSTLSRRSFDRGFSNQSRFNNRDRREGFSSVAREERRATREQNRIDRQGLDRTERRALREERRDNQVADRTERRVERRGFRTIKGTSGRTSPRTGQVSSQASTLQQERSANRANNSVRRSTRIIKNSASRRSAADIVASRSTSQTRPAQTRSPQRSSAPKTPVKATSRNSSSSATSQRSPQRQSTRKSTSQTKPKSQAKRQSARQSTRQSGRSISRSTNRTFKKSSRSNTRRKLNFFSKSSLFGASSYRVYRSSEIVRCAREENLSVHISYDRLEAALDTGLTIFVLDRDGQDIPVYIPPNYIEGFGIAAFSSPHTP